jgi:hypothetical protein
MILAADEEIIMRDGSRQRADEVKAGESFMPLYRKVYEASKKLFDRYEKVYNPNSGKFEFTHRLVGKEVEKLDELYNTIHHKDFNKYNNNPTNLMWMDYHDHHRMHGDLSRALWKDEEKRKLHCEHLSQACRGRVISDETKSKISKTMSERWASGKLDYLRDVVRNNFSEYKKTDEYHEMLRERGLKLGYREEFREYNNSELHKQHDEIRRKSMKEYWSSNTNRVQHVRNMRVEFDEHVWGEIEDAIVSGKIYSQNSMIRYINENLIDYLKTTNVSNKLKSYSKVTKPLVAARIRERGFANCDEYLESIEEKYKLQSHYDVLNAERSKIAMKYNLIKNITSTFKASENREVISKRTSENNKKRDRSIYEKTANSNRLMFDTIVWDGLREEILAGNVTNATSLFDTINEKFIDHIREIKTSGHKIGDKISRGAIRRLIQKTYGVEKVNDYIAAMKKNHKITSIEVIGGDDVYCMTVVGLNGEEDRHNFALLSWKEDGSVNDSGVFVSNCVQDDVFIPVRSENAPNPIDTLSAGQNMTALDDIKYVQNKICAALRIPRTFLNFEEAAGDGKNLALMDIRFTRTINRIQQAFLMELTKVATIHLFLLGFDDELTNFTLSMNNPSTQAEQLEIENLQKKIGAVRDAVSDPGTGIPPMSLVRALKTIMKWSEKDIKENFEEIRLEKGLAAELEKTTQIIKKTGIFDSIDRIYGEPGAKYMDDQQGGQGGMDGGPGGGGPMGGGGPTDFGSELDSMGDVGADTGGDIVGNEGEMPIGDMDPGTEAAQPMEGTSKDGKLIMDDMMKKYLNMINEKHDKGNVFKRVEPHDMDSLFINEELDRMRNSLEEFISEKK